MKITANQAQLRASDPKNSVWVSASAGSGKTKVLTDRVLRLLLTGVVPAKILCITYTKAAAAEMLERINSRLSKWVMQPTDGDGGLYGELEELTGQKPSAELLRQARQLFAKTLDDSPSVRIQTIHAFCQSVLGRFPIEARVPTNFAIIDERTSFEILENAKKRLLDIQIGGGQADDTLKESLILLSDNLGEYGFDEMLNNIIDNLKTYRQIFEQPAGIAKNEGAIADFLGVDWNSSNDKIVADSLPFTEERLQYVAKAIDAFSEYGTDTERRDKLGGLNNVLDCRLHENGITLEEVFAEYKKIFLTTKNTVRASMAAKKMRNNAPDVCEWLASEAFIVKQVSDVINNFNCAKISRALLYIAEKIFTLYEYEKTTRSLLDYDDLIIKTKNLLCSDKSIPWVMYKLDGGIDHLLIDEAQDTAPEQWQITVALIEEFFAGEGRKGGNRTLFVVGDKKQSIYGFQGADIKNYISYQQYFAEFITSRGKIFDVVEMDISFRSSQGILDLVDNVFASDVAKSGVAIGDEVVKHTAYRGFACSHAEVMPLIAYDNNGDKADDVSQDGETWPIAKSQNIYIDTKRQLAKIIVSNIAKLLGENRIIKRGDKNINEGNGRVITPQDILILVQKRSGGLVDYISYELKQNGIPTSGLDRMSLNDHIAVQDMIALAKFLLLPADDLNLCNLLKSPLYNLNDEHIFELCYNRKASVWHGLQSYNGNDDLLVIVRNNLSELLGKTDYITPYKLFAELLYAKGGMSAYIRRMGEQVAEPLNIFLSELLNYEKSHSAVSMQGFVQWITKGNTQIKRDMEQGGDVVRIMTTHGAKGLQAPIVILPDTISMQSKTKSTLVHRHRGNDMVLYKPANEESSEKLTKVKEQQMLDAEEEKHRLLYVAMTRAEDELYIAGYLNKKENMQGASGEKIMEKSWYGIISRAMAQNPDVNIMGNEEWQDYDCGGDGGSNISGNHKYLGRSPHPSPLPQGEGSDGRAVTGEGIITRNINYCKIGDGLVAVGDWLVVDDSDGEAIMGEGGIVENIVDIDDVSKVLPLHFYAKPPAESKPTKPLNPSNLEGDLPSDGSPLDFVKRNNSGGLSPNEKGNIIHKLLQLLPNVASDNQMEYGQKILDKMSENISKEEKNNILQEVVTVISHSDFADIFVANAMSEVSISGVIDDENNSDDLAKGAVISGKIDRLIVGDDKVIIVDFKTGIVPKSVGEIPNTYKRQMNAYGSLIAQIYPEKPITKILLYTRELKLFEC